MRSTPLTEYTPDLDNDFFVLHPDLTYTLQDGSRHFYMRDEDDDLIFHRDVGPAIIWANGNLEWWLRGVCCSFDEWLDRLDRTSEEKVMLKLVLG